MKCFFAFVAMHYIACNMQERYEHVKGVLLPFLRTSGFREAHIQWLPAVGPSGQNLTGPPTEPALAAWWRGPSVMDAIEAFRPAARILNRPLRMPVTDVFKGSRGGAAVGGKIEGGALKVGEASYNVLLMPQINSKILRCSKQSILRTHCARYHTASKWRSLSCSI